MAVTYGGAVAAGAKTVVDTAASQATGAACTGINFAANGVAGAAAGADEAAIANCRIGSAADASVKVEQGDGVGL